MRPFLDFCRCISNATIVLFFGLLGKILNAALVVTLACIFFVAGTPLTGTTVDRFVSLAMELVTGEQVSIQDVRLVWDLREQIIEVQSANTVIGTKNNSGGLSWQSMRGILHYGLNHDHGYEITDLTLEQPMVRVVLHSENKRSLWSRTHQVEPLFVLDPSSWISSILEKLPVRMLAVNNGQVWLFDDMSPVPLASLKDITGTIQASAVGVNGAVVGSLKIGLITVPLQMTLSGTNVGGIFPQLMLTVTSSEPTAGVAAVVGSGTLTILIDFIKRSVQIDNAQLRLAGGTLRASVAAVWDSAMHQAAITGHIALDLLDFASLRQLWPEGLAPNPRAWIFANLDAGNIRTLHLQLGLGVHQTANGIGLTLHELKGGMRLDNFIVHYLGDLPSVQQTSGNATFDANSFHIVLDSGVCQGVRIVGGTVSFLGLDDDDQEVVIDLKLFGSLSDHLTIINAAPLHYADVFGLLPGQTSGSSETHFFARFPPLNDLPVSQLHIDVNGKLKDVGFSVPKTALRLQQLNGVLFITPQGAKINGHGLLNGIANDLLWERDFTGKAAITETAIINATNVMPEQLLSLGVDLGQRLRGVVGATVTWQRKTSGKSSVVLRADMMRAMVEMPWIFWDKPINVPASLEANISINERSTQIESVVLVSGKDVLRGNGKMQNGSVNFFETTVLKLGDTHGSVNYSVSKAGGYSIVGNFKSLRLRPLEIPDDKGGSDKKKPPLDINRAIDSLKSNTGANAKKVTLRYQQRNGQTMQANVQGFIIKNDGAVPFSARLAEKKLTVEAKDAGSVLAAFGIYSNMRSGDLTGTIYLGDPSVYELTVKDFGLWRAPLLGKILSVASITAPVDLLMGNGLPFSILTAKGRLSDSILFLDDMKMTGSSLGILASGTINLHDEQLDIKGAVMPAYIVTQIIGGIPLIGDFLTQNKQEGIIAVRYTAEGALNNPSIRVNPLTAFTPGVFRGVFDLFETPKARDIP
jgi:hypothetical protein